MNKLIKELHDKAFDGIDILEANWFLKHNKKFAELIVKECMYVGRLSQINNGLVDSDIKDHFYGVE